MCLLRALAIGYHCLQWQRVAVFVLPCSASRKACAYLQASTYEAGVALPRLHWSRSQQRWPGAGPMMDDVRLANHPTQRPLRKSGWRKGEGGLSRRYNDGVKLVGWQVGV